MWYDKKVPVVAATDVYAPPRIMIEVRISLAGQLIGALPQALRSPTCVKSTTITTKVGPRLPKSVLAIALNESAHY